METEDYIEVPGMAITPGELRHPGARSLAFAIEERPYFKLIGCRRYTPEQLESDQATDVKSGASNLIIPYPEMNEQELRAVEEVVKQQKNAATKSDFKPLSPMWRGEAEGQIGEFVIFEVDANVPQHPVHEIELTERLAATFIFDAEAQRWDNLPPQTVALRRNFPTVPHLNARSDNGTDHLLCLCLWEESHQEIELKWTPALHLDRVWHWLSKTARGELHPPDQPLEPLFFLARDYLLVPPSLLRLNAEISGAPNETSFRGRLVQTAPFTTYIADGNTGGAHHQMNFASIVLRAQPQTHGVIKHPPRTLSELQEYGKGVGLDILREVRAQLLEWRADKSLWKAHIVFVLLLPSRRTDQSAPEKHEVYGFTTLRDMISLGVSLKVWEYANNGLMPLMQSDYASGQTPIYPLNVAPLLQRASAQLFNAQAVAAKQPKVTALGAGALGSQVFTNLARSGWGDWVVIDGDLFLPHNGARHTLDGADLGLGKASACCAKANSLFDSSFQATPIFAHYNGDESPDSPVGQALSSSDLVLDFSASVAAARTLADAPRPCARRISLFLNPAGTQMMILAEDSARELTLTDLEMQFWRAIVTDENWGDYFAGVAGERVRYARSCGDVSARLSQDLVALHSAGAARALRPVVSNNEAALLRWTADTSTGEVRRSQWTLSPVQEWQIGQWRVRASEDVMRELWEMRRTRLPLETGGILLGVFDCKRQIAHLVAALPAPPDSQECNDSFLRGYEGLSAAKERAEALSGGAVSYLGEWHSHPEGHDATRSARDYDNFGFLKEHRQADGLPPIMLILADKGECAWFVGEMTPPEPTIIILVQKQ